MRESLELVIIAITLLVAALVVLTIFGSGMSLFGNLTSFKTSCITTGQVACTSGGSEPATWHQRVNVGGEQKSCSDIATFSACCTGTPPTWNSQTSGCA